MAWGASAVMVADEGMLPASTRLGAMFTVPASSLLLSASKELDSSLSSSLSLSLLLSLSSSLSTAASSFRMPLGLSTCIPLIGSSSKSGFCGISLAGRARIAHSVFATKILVSVDALRIDLNNVLKWPLAKSTSRFSVYVTPSGSWCTQLALSPPGRIADMLLASSWPFCSGMGITIKITTSPPICPAIASAIGCMCCEIASSCLDEG